jgi:2-oxoglutarate ferredoxin oxidoreductase subunit beta
MPDNIVFTYAGDGDTCAIGLGDLMHAANKGMPITTIMVNNTVFGMTGGQMSPTTLVGQVTATTVKGRDVTLQGYPLLVPEMMQSMAGVKFLARESVATPKAIRKAKKSIRKAFECQVKGLGYSFVEVIVPCPTGLKMRVKDAYVRCANEMTDYFKPQSSRTRRSNQCCINVRFPVREARAPRSWRR